jgi:2'-hydroxyisoflavone reductase
MNQHNNDRGEGIEGGAADGLLGGISRRRIVQLGLAAGAVAVAAGMGFGKDDPKAGEKNNAAADEKKNAKGLKILILGGTGFLGPACIESAKSHGHTVTVFNRGRTEDRRKKAGRPSAIPDGVEVLYGNRDPEKTADDWKDDPRQNPQAEAKDPASPKGLSQLEGRTWDAVIDTSAYFPRIAKASAELLSKSVKQYVFVSTVSVYAANDEPGADETAKVGELSDPKTEDFGADYSNYGPGKAACEKAIEAAMPGRVTSVRPGFIVGPRDTSGRWCYWPDRLERAAKDGAADAANGMVLVPGAPEDPIQFVDVRDLADFIVHCIETGAMGTMNVTSEPMPMKAMVEGCRDALPEADRKPITFAWVGLEALGKQGVEPGAAFPLYVPSEGETAGFHRRSVARAMKAGLKCRPVRETARATLDWLGTMPTEGANNMRARLLPPTALTAAQEREIVAMAAVTQKPESAPVEKTPK